MNKVFIGLDATTHFSRNVDARGVYGSVRFRPKKPTEPNYSIVVKNEPNRTGTGSVKSGFLRKKPGNLIPWVFLVFFLIGLRFGKI